MIRLKGRLAVIRNAMSSLVDELVTRIFGFDVFISHTRDGKSYATSLERSLVAAGKRCFLDQSELHVGVPLRRKVADALGHSGMLVVVATDGARKAPWTIAEARFYRRYRPYDPIVPLAFGDPPGSIGWPGINHDLFEAEADHVLLEPGWRGRFAVRRAALWDGLRKRLGADPGTAVEEYLGFADSPSNLEAATPDPAVVVRVVEAQRRLAVSSRARRGGLAALAMMAARYYRNLPTERLDAARASLVALGYQVTDNLRADYRVAWDAQESAQGPLTEDRWRQASGPLRMIDRYANIAAIELIYTDVGDLGPLAELTSLGSLKVLGGPTRDLAPLARLDRLEALALADLRGIDDDDLAVLRNFGRLGILYLTACPGVTDRGLDHLAGLPLRELTLSDCRKVDNRGLARLAGLPLEQLAINRTGARIDQGLVDFLLGFPGLRSVEIGGLRDDPAQQRRLRESAAKRDLRVSPRPQARKPTPTPGTPPATTKRPPPAAGPDPPTGRSASSPGPDPSNAPDHQEDKP